MTDRKNQRQSADLTGPRLRPPPHGPQYTPEYASSQNSDVAVPFAKRRVAHIMTHRRPNKLPRHTTQHDSLQRNVTQQNTASLK